MGEYTSGDEKVIARDIPVVVGSGTSLPGDHMRQGKGWQGEQPIGLYQFNGSASSLDHTHSNSSSEQLHPVCQCTCLSVSVAVHVCLSVWLYMYVCQCGCTCMSVSVAVHVCLSVWLYMYAGVFANDVYYLVPRLARILSLMGPFMTFPYPPHLRRGPVETGQEQVPTASWTGWMRTSPILPLRGGGLSIMGTSGMSTSTCARQWTHRGTRTPRTWRWRGAPPPHQSLGRM